MLEFAEIRKLRDMLDASGIPYEYSDRSTSFEQVIWPFYQIGYPSIAQFVCSVVEGHFTYGYDEDKLEIMGLLTNEEEEHDTVVGYLTADEVFMRIKNHFDGGNKNG